MVTLFLVNSIVVAVVVIIHYECLFRMTLAIPKISIPHRYNILLGVFVGLIAHAAEIWVFAFAFYFMHHQPGWGALTGNFDGSVMDCVYFSFTTYTTLGFGDIEPLGDLRFLVGIESLTGLVLITWTASFLFLEMQRYWKTR